MRKLLILILTLLIPVMFFLEVYGAFSTGKLNDRIAALEAEQDEWLEKNKKLIVAIQVYRTPERIEKIAREELNLSKIDSKRITRLLLSGNEE
jgi:cell division protein FtsL